MCQLLKTEWLKVKNYRTFWILSALYLLSIWGINYIVYVIQHEVYTNKDAGNAANMLLGTPPYDFPLVWQTATNVSSYLLFIAGLIMIISLTNEFSFKTHRQNIIDGATRTEFIITKLICGLIVALASTLFVFLTVIFFGLIKSNSSFSLENSRYIFFFFLEALNYCWLAIVFSLLFKRSGISIGVFFLYTIVLENVLVQALNHYADGTGKYLPIQSSDELLPFPLFQKLKQQIVPDDVNTTVQLVLVLLYLAAYFFFSKRKFERDDL